MGKVKDVLVAARNRIARGWTQYSGQDHRGHVCSVFALNAAATEVLHSGDHNCRSCDAANQAGAVLIQAISEVTGSDWSGNIVGWNDYPGRTQDEVLHAFDHAIKLADRDER